MESWKKAEIDGFWMESSENEKRLAAYVADEFLRLQTDGHAIEQSIQQLVEYLIQPDQSPTINDDAVRDIIAGCRDLNLIDFGKAAPESDQDLTSNFISCLVLEIRARENELAQKGVVLTPFRLALGMVKMAADSWIRESLNLELDNKNVENYQIGKIRHAIWLDPCVGGGVFPIAILSHLMSLGMPLDEDIVDKIKGSDIDALYVFATKIRIAAFISKNRAGSFRKILQRLDSQFTVANTLLLNSEQSSFDIFSSDEVRSDIVIGNPPYVRAEKIPKEEKMILKSLYPSVFSGAGDLYVYFIANGINALRHNGILCFVSPAAFQKTRYGSGIREYIEDHARVSALFDFDELPVFQNIGAHISVYLLVKNQVRKNVLARSYKHLPDRSEELFSNPINLPDGNISKDGWSVSTNNVGIFLRGMRKHSLALSEYIGGGICSGVKTGHQKAFVIDERTAEPFLRDERTKGFIRPLVRAKDIKRWKTSNQEQRFYLIVTRKGAVVPDDSELMSHLLKYKNELSSRSDLQSGIWYSLRDCSYYSLLEKPKIIYPDISKFSRFTIDRDGTYLTDGAFFIPLEDYYLLGLLNSSLALDYFRIKCTSIGNPENRGRLRFKKVYVESFPVRKKTEKNKDIQDRIANEAKSLMGGSGSQEILDGLVRDLYEDCSI